ncbi:MAG: hypothetical protein AAES65_10870 [Candidatus Thiodiazotropha sp. (ex. Lucinoma kazani)]
MIAQLNQNRTIEYRLEFANINEEYQYEIRRYASQKMLLQMAFQEQSSEPNKMRMIDPSLKDAELLREEAEMHARWDRYQEALNTQELAVEKLNSALRLMGYFF